jgi:hypothetical protein
MSTTFKVNGRQVSVDVHLQPRLLSLSAEFILTRTGS